MRPSIALLPFGIILLSIFQLSFDHPSPLEPAPRPLARKWGCDDVRCNIYPLAPGAVCPDRVIGHADYRHASYQDACNAAMDDANRQVPRGCNKRHCNCNTKCSER